jgi:hypothetical protein
MESSAQPAFDNSCPQIVTVSRCAWSVISIHSDKPLEPGILLPSGGIYGGQGESSLAGEVRNESPYAQVDDTLRVPLEDSPSSRNDRPAIPTATISQQLCGKPDGVAQAIPARSSRHQSSNARGELASTIAKFLAVPSVGFCYLLLRCRFYPLPLVQAFDKSHADNC